MRVALYSKMRGDWIFVAEDTCGEHERQDFRDAAIRFAESDRSFGQERDYVYVVMRGVPPKYIHNLDVWEKL
jgi:hypothetical protein